MPLAEAEDVDAPPQQTLRRSSSWSEGGGRCSYLVAKQHHLVEEGRDGVESPRHDTCKYKEGDGVVRAFEDTPPTSCCLATWSSV